MTMTAEQIVGGDPGLVPIGRNALDRRLQRWQGLDREPAIVWTALLGLKPAERTKMVYVISTDTLVETR